MIIYIGAYVFIALATTIAVFDNDSFPRRSELIASVITGAMWPLLLTVRVIMKLVK
jgi:hypothetical protein